MVRWCRGELRCIAQPDQPGQGFLFELVFGHGLAVGWCKRDATVKTLISQFPCLVSLLFMGGLGWEG